MAEAQPTLEEWQRLYQAAVRFMEVGPWEWMEEVDVLGVQNPETGELGFASVMGMLGEHYALALYLGAEGLYGFWRYGAAAAAGTAPPEELLNLLHLQASFEDRAELTDRDRGVIKELGFRFRGRQAWPFFRSYRPGLCPWYLEAAEVRFLAHALEQMVEVAPRFRVDPDLLAPPGDYDYLVRVPREEKGELVWEERVMEVRPPEPEPIELTMDMEALAGVKQLPRSEQTVEIDFSLLAICIGERGERPYYPYMLLVVDADSGLILANEFVEPKPSLNAMWGRVPETLVHMFAGLGLVPARVRVREPVLSGVLRPLARELGFELEPARSLPAAKEAKESLVQALGRG
jgi:hypothetical protein